MLIYEVNIEVDNKILQDYMLWLRQHIVEMLCFDGFKSAKILALDQDPNQVKNINNTNLIVQYEVASKEQLENYFILHAPGMRKANQYANDVKIERRVLNIDQVLT